MQCPRYKLYWFYILKIIWKIWKKNLSKLKRKTIKCNLKVIDKFTYIQPNNCHIKEWSALIYLYNKYHKTTNVNVTSLRHFLGQLSQTQNWTTLFNYINIPLHESWNWSDFLTTRCVYVGQCLHLALKFPWRLLMLM
jgi:hypothetical protein